ncbi:hypothetical protein C7B80_26660 [Cyanosarcina cf. burmensis CCALA 770]|nr:hypothetical protein C7B80_26660 [Cyanosarcina cf. burmensis CCALA 770]
MADTTQNQENFFKIPILELREKYSIGRDPLYARMRYLRITTWKVSGKAYLDADQVAHMDGLHEHIQQTGRMEGYPIPEPSGPVELEPEETTAIVEAAPQQMSAQPNYSPAGGRAHNSETEAIAAMVRNAQNKAAGMLIAENMLAQQFIQNPDKLPEELRAKINESAAPPAVDPFAYASALMNFAGLAA